MEKVYVLAVIVAGPTATVEVTTDLSKHFDLQKSYNEHLRSFLQVVRQDSPEGFWFEIAKRSRKILQDSFGNYRLKYSELNDMVQEQMKGIVPEKIQSVDLVDDILYGLPATTYHMRRFMFDKLKSTREGMKNGSFGLILKLSEILEVLQQIPDNFKMLKKEAAYLLDFIEDRVCYEHDDVKDIYWYKVSGDLIYTYQFICEYLIEEGHELAEAYFRGRFGDRHGRLRDVSGYYSYTPFRSRVEENWAEIPEDPEDFFGNGFDLIPTANNIFNNKLTEIKFDYRLSSQYYLYDGNDPVLLIEEDKYLYNLEKSLYNSLPERFSYEDIIFAKLAPTKESRLKYGPISSKLPSLGESNARVLFPSDYGFHFDESYLQGMDLHEFESKVVTSFEDTYFLKRISEFDAYETPIEELRERYPELMANGTLQVMVTSMVNPASSDNSYEWCLNEIERDYSDYEKHESFVRLLKAKCFVKASGQPSVVPEQSGKIAIEKEAPISRNMDLF